MNNMLNGMFGKVAPGMCRLSMNGGIAVKTNNGYKSYNMKTGRLTNCDSFVFDIGEEFFFVIPTNKAEPGDILLVGGKPKCGKIVSMFGSDLIKGKKGTNKIMQYMMLSEMMKGNSGSGGSGMSAMLPLMMMGGNMGNILEGMFDFGEDDDSEAEESEEE